MTRPASIRCERPGAMYARGEEVAFLADAGGDGRDLVCDLTWDGCAPIGRVPVTDGSAPVAARAIGDRPGFIRARLLAPDGSVACEAAAAVSPREIAPSMPAPGDFDAFWEQRIAAWRGAPLDAAVSPRPGADGVRVDAVRLPTPDGLAIYGWLMRPEAPGPYPALVLYHGAGVYAVGPQHGQDWVRHGYMVFSMNPHPISNEEPASTYAELSAGDLGGYRFHGREDRERLAFVPMFQRAAFAIDYVASLPDWDGRHLHAEGHSQGGGQALAAAALNPRATGVSVSCPTHCDHTGPVVGRVAGWPQIVEVANGIPNPRHVEAARYIDGVNFASRIRRPALFGVCYLDSLCPPTGVYAAFNALPGPGQVHDEPEVGHDHPQAYRDAAFRWAREIADRPTR